MTEYFVESDFLEVKAQRKRVLITYFIVLGAYLLVSIANFIWYKTLPYKSSKILLVKIIEFATTIVMVIFSLIYFGIKYKRVNRFYRTGNHLLTALKETSTGSFLRYDETIQDRDGVDCKSLIFLEWNKYKKDFFERKVLVFNEWDFPEIPENANVRYVTQGNVLVSYEILDYDNEQKEQK